MSSRIKKQKNKKQKTKPIKKPRHISVKILKNKGKETNLKVART